MYPAAVLHTEKSFRNLIKLNRNQILFTIFRLIPNQSDVRLVRNQPGNCQYNLTLNKISKRFLTGLVKRATRVPAALR